ETGLGVGRRLIPVEPPALRDVRLPFRVLAGRRAPPAMDGAGSYLRRMHLGHRIYCRVDVETKRGRLPLGLHKLPPPPARIDKLGLFSDLVRLRINVGVSARQIRRPHSSHRHHLQALNHIEFSHHITLYLVYYITYTM